MFTLVQEGLTPLTESQMNDLEITVATFLDESEPGPINTQDLTDTLLSEALAGEWHDFPRRPTRLEIMAACCGLEALGEAEFEFVDGQLCVTRATSPR